MAPEILLIAFPLDGLGVYSSVTFNTSILFVPSKISSVILSAKFLIILIHSYSTISAHMGHFFFLEEKKLAWPIIILQVELGAIRASSNIPALVVMMEAETIEDYLNIKKSYEMKC
ncbi:MAG TPA: hypothetical protein VK469_03115 [Candidatus Kapabacteria bacterium]|nr:hypothetical protein [Candidatus Kapabacteria bacterium]